MKRERFLGGCLTLGVMLFAASFVFYGWSTPLRSMASFGTSAGLAEAGPAESEIISQALEAYGVGLNEKSPWTDTICSAPASAPYYSWMEMPQVTVHGYNNQHRRYGRQPPEGFEELDVREGPIEYTPFALRDLGARIDPDGNRFLVPWPWQTGR